jgi:signal peptidase II
MTWITRTPVVRRDRRGGPGGNPLNVKVERSAGHPRPPRSLERVLSAEPEDARGDESGAAPATPVNTAPGRRPRTRLLLAIAVGVLLLDIGSKLLVVATLDRGEDVRLLGGALHLTHARNTGAAFSFAEGFTVVFTLIAAAVAVVIVRASRRLFSLGWAVALGLVLGGAVGNLLDRVFRDPGFLRGGVVDFISVFAPGGEFFPIFNLADSAITCGGILGAVLALRGIEFDGSRAGAGDSDGDVGSDRG